MPCISTSGAPTPGFDEMPADGLAFPRRIDEPMGDRQATDILVLAIGIPRFAARPPSAAIPTRIAAISGF